MNEIEIINEDRDNLKMKYDNEDKLTKEIESQQK